MDRGGRWLLVIIGMSYIGMSTQLHPPYYLADIVDGMPFFWEVVFAGAGAACFATAVWPDSWWPWVAGALVTLAAASRGVAVLMVALVDPNVSALPAMQWTLILALQIHLWPEIAPRPNRR